MCCGSVRVLSEWGSQHGCVKAFTLSSLLTVSHFPTANQQHHCLRIRLIGAWSQAIIFYKYKCIILQICTNHVSPHTYPPPAAAHSLSCFPLQQLFGPHCRQCPPLNGFGFGCHGDRRLESVLTGSWVAGWAPGAVPGSPPPPPAPAAPMPGAHQLHPPAWMTEFPTETGGGASLWG